MGYASIIRFFPAVLLGQVQGHWVKRSKCNIKDHTYITFWPLISTKRHWVWPSNTVNQKGHNLDNRSRFNCKSWPNSWPFVQIVIFLVCSVNICYGKNTCRRHFQNSRWHRTYEFWHMHSMKPTLCFACDTTHSAPLLGRWWDCVCMLSMHCIDCSWNDIGHGNMVTAISCMVAPPFYNARILQNKDQLLQFR